MRICKLKNVNGNIDEFPCYTASDFPYNALTALCMKTNRKNYGKSYLTNICAFDIETTTLVHKSIGYMYHWQFCIDGYVAYGRLWNDYINFLRQLRLALNVNEERLLSVYVHNLGYEFQFMKDFMAREWSPAKIFAAQPRKPIRLTYECGFEFRCSWKLSNMSLEKFLHNEKGVEHLKRRGDLDYKITRTPDTPLNDTEFGYCISDVVGLYEGIRQRLSNEHDNLETIPMTSTGYVRRDCRKAASKQKGYRDIFNRNKMTVSVYDLLKSAARGGDTHANRFLAGRIIEGVDSYDVQSSYPAMMLLSRFPMTSFVPYGDISIRTELEELLDSKACLFRLTCIGISVKDGISMPYIPDSKCTHLLEPVRDNGRVLSAQGLSMTVTDIDYKIIKSQYDIEEEYVSNIHIAEYGFLPESIRETVLDYFRRKTELKAHIKEMEHFIGPWTEEMKTCYEDLCYNYQKSKNRLNGIFGMCYTDPVRDVIEMLDDGSWKQTRPEDIGAALKKYQDSRNSFLVYAWGVWVTCHAREHLARLRTAAGEMKCAYQDTDSEKGAGLDHEAIERENLQIIKECESRGAYADCKGNRYYMGVYEHENPVPYKAFKTLGSKKYTYVDDKGLHVTVSGVNKEFGAEELEDIDNFVPGFIFRKAGGVELVYNESSIHNITVDGCTFETASNIAMLDSTYMLGATDTYMDLIGLSPIEIINYNRVKEKRRKEKNEKTGEQQFTERETGSAGTRKEA